MIVRSRRDCRIRDSLEPSQIGYNAAWLHGYASALADSAELYEILHDHLNLPNERIAALGFDLPQCAEPRRKPHKSQRRIPSHER